MGGLLRDREYENCRLVEDSLVTEVFVSHMWKVLIRKKNSRLQMDLMGEKVVVLWNLALRFLPSRLPVLALLISKTKTQMQNCGE